MFAASIEARIQARPHRSAGDEEVAAVADEARRPEAERNDTDRIDDEQYEMDVQRGPAGGRSTV
jgi:hypothetical protein